LRHNVYLYRMLDQVVRRLYDNALTDPLPERLKPYAPPAHKPRHN
jgi:hypothetical protein